MIRCVRLWTGDEGDSHFEEGTIDLSRGARGDVLSEVVAAASLLFQETNYWLRVFPTVQYCL
jgi:hypothetical protein